MTRRSPDASLRLILRKQYVGSKLDICDWERNKYKNHVFQKNFINYVVLVDSFPFNNNKFLKEKICYSSYLYRSVANCLNRKTNSYRTSWMVLINRHKLAGRLELEHGCSTRHRPKVNTLAPTEKSKSANISNWSFLPKRQLVLRLYRNFIRWGQTWEEYNSSYLNCSLKQVIFVSASAVHKVNEF